MSPKNPLFILLLLVLAAGGGFIASKLHRAPASTEQPVAEKVEVPNQQFAETNNITDLSACKEGDDCVPVEEACPGSYSAINSKYKDLHEKRMAEVRKYIECTGAPAGQKHPDKAACLNGKCTLAPYN